MLEVKSGALAQVAEDSSRDGGDIIVPEKNHQRVGGKVTWYVREAAGGSREPSVAGSGSTASAALRQGARGQDQNGHC